MHSGRTSSPGPGGCESPENPNLRTCVRRNSGSLPCGGRDFGPARPYRSDMGKRPPPSTRHSGATTIRSNRTNRRPPIRPEARSMLNEPTAGPTTSKGVVPSILRSPCLAPCLTPSQNTARSIETPQPQLRHLPTQRVRIERHRPSTAGRQTNTIRSSVVPAERHQSIPEMRTTRTAVPRQPTGLTSHRLVR